MTEQTVRTLFSASAQKALFAAAASAFVGFLVFQTWTIQRKEQEIAGLRARSAQFRVEGERLRALRDQVRSWSRGRLSRARAVTGRISDVFFVV